MQAASQWDLIRRDLPEGWTEAHLAFAVEEPAAVPIAAGVLAPLGPGRTGVELRFHVRSSGGETQTVANLLGRLDRKRVWGTLSIVETHLARPVGSPAEATNGARGLVELWDAAVAELPAGWRDLLCELGLDSSDHVPRAALLGAPLNPTRNRAPIALRFRVSRGGGYGASPGMARRCLERMDAEGITGRVSVLLGLSDTENAVTQGPVWRIARRSV